MNKLKVIILAAGEGKRMKSKLPKVLHKIQGRAMAEHVIDTAEKAGADDICVVVGHGADMVKTALQGRNVKFAVQEKQLGTGHAVMQAGDFIDENADILVLVAIRLSLLRRRLKSCWISTGVKTTASQSFPPLWMIRRDTAIL